MPSRRKSQPIFLPPGAGRAYPMGRLHSVFKADGAETRRRYSLSEWWLEPDTHGPPPHRHDEEHAWFILEGTMNILIGKTWTRAPKGSFLVIPGGTLHTFDNPGRKRAGMLSLSIPGGFEDSMPGIQGWFLENPPGKARATAATAPDTPARSRRASAAGTSSSRRASPASSRRRRS